MVTTKTTSKNYTQEEMRKESNKSLQKNLLNTKQGSNAGNELQKRY